MNSKKISILYNGMLIVHLFIIFYFVFQLTETNDNTYFICLMFSFIFCVWLEVVIINLIIKFKSVTEYSINNLKEKVMNIDKRIKDEKYILKEHSSNNTIKRYEKRHLLNHDVIRRIITIDTAKLSTKQIIESIKEVQCEIKSEISIIDKLKTNKYRSTKNILIILTKNRNREITDFLKNNAIIDLEPRFDYGLAIPKDYFIPLVIIENENLILFGTLPKESIFSTKIMAFEGIKDYIIKDADDSLLNKI